MAPPVIDILPADITEERTDLVVNPASKVLAFGGEVSKALLAKCPDLKQRSKAAIGHIEQHGYNIVKYKPVGKGRELWCLNIDAQSPKRDVLVDILHASVPELERKQVTSMSIPAIGAGKSRLPYERSANLVLGALLEWFDKEGNKIDFIDQIRVVIYQNQELYDKFLAEHSGERGDHEVMAAPLPRGRGGDADHLRWVDVPRDDPEYSRVARNAAELGHAIQRVQRPELAEELARQALARIAGASRGPSQARGAPEGATRGGAGGEGEDERSYAVVFRDRVGVPEHRVFFDSGSTSGD